jgi:hypothetical protein
MLLKGKAVIELFSAKLHKFTRIPQARRSDGSAKSQVVVCEGRDGRQATEGELRVAPCTQFSPLPSFVVVIQKGNPRLSPQADAAFVLLARQAFLLQVGAGTAGQLLKVDFVRVEFRAVHASETHLIADGDAARVDTPHWRVSSAAARIIGMGPITWAAPTGDDWVAFQARIRSTTVPCNPAEPSSVAH